MRIVLEVALTRGLEQLEREMEDLSSSLADKNFYPWLIDTVVPEDRRRTVGQHCSTETEPAIRVDVVCPQLWSLTNAAT